MRVLITGGCGDVGLSLSKSLLASEHSAVVYDVKRRSLPNGVDFVEGDVRDFTAIAHAAQGCDAGIHLAVMAEESSEEDIMSVNVLGTYGFLLAAWKAKFRNSIIASSAPVHLPPGELGDGFLLRTSEGKNHVYDLTKALQEVIGRDFHAHGLPVLCLRFGHIVLGKEESNLKRTNPLKDVDYCRGGWVALEDVVAACAAALETPPTADFEILNLVGAKGARERFHVAKTEERLGVNLEYDFTAYE